MTISRRNIAGIRSAIDAVVDKLDALKSLNINAIEFMPWIAWPDDAAFSWGYDPAYFFSVEFAYVNDVANRYSFLMDLRLQHKGLRSPNFYPNDYDWNWHNFSPDGYGIDEQRQVIIYHRWGDANDLVLAGELASEFRS